MIIRNLEVNGLVGLSDSSRAARIQIISTRWLEMPLC